MRIARVSTSLVASITILSSLAAVVTGRIVDEKSEPVMGVNVKLLSLPDSVFIKGASTGIDGDFTIDSVPTGRMALVPEYFGLKASPLVVRVDSPRDSLTLPAITMRDETKLLDDLLVTGYRSAVTTKQDTIEFNAGSFKTKQNAVVEDLLKKLPGVEVGSDGSITSNGKSVTKILVDGEEFFNDDPKMASKNLPADMVEKVQVVDRKSDLARLTGVDDGEEETVINLTVKKDRKNGWFGNVTGGYGTDSRYNFGFNVNRFHNGNQYTFLGGANNVNDLTFTDSGRGRFRMGSGNAMDGITTSQSLGFNFAVGSSEKLRVGGNILYTHNKQDYDKQSSTQYLFPDSTSYENSWTRSRNEGHNVRTDMRMQWKISQNDDLDVRARFAFNNRNVESNDTSKVYAGDALRTPVNRQDNFQHTSGNSYDANGEIIYSHRVASHPGRSMSVQANYRFSDTKESGTSWSDIMFYLQQDDSEKLYRFIDNHQWSNSINSRFTWTEPLGDVSKGNFLNVAYRFNYNFNDADKLTYNVPFEDEMTEKLFYSLNIGAADGVLDNSLSNRFRNEFFSQELQVSYKKVHRLYDLEAGLIYTPSMSKSKDLISSSRDIPAYWTHNFAPFLRMRYKFSKTKNLRLDYRARTTQPTISQLQPVADESNPLQITIGNPELKPTFTQNLHFRFSNFNSQDQSALMTMMRVSYSLNSIVSRTTSDPISGVRTTTYANVDNAFSLMGGVMYNRPIYRGHWRVSGDLFANYSNSPGYVNGDLNRSSNLSLNVRPGVTYTMDLLQVSVRPQYSLQYTQNSLPQQPNRTIHTYGVNGDASVTLPMGIEFSTDVDFTKSAGYASGYNNDMCLWNAQISYSLLKSRSLTLALKVYDLLQQKNTVSRNVTATYISDSRVNSLTRYFMLTLTWRFQSLGVDKSQTDMMPGGEFGPPGPPPGERGQGGRMPGPPPRF